MSSRTVFLSKLIGLYCIFLALSLLLNKQRITGEIIALVHDPPVLLVTGVFTLFAGLAMVLGHNLWRGGAVTVVVTVIGWLTLLKALLLLFLPPAMLSQFFLETLHSGQMYYFRLALTLVLGVYLTYGGFAAFAEDQNSAG